MKIVVAYTQNAQHIFELILSMAHKALENISIANMCMLIDILIYYTGSFHCMLCARSLCAVHYAYFTCTRASCTWNAERIENVRALCVIHLGTHHINGRFCILKFYGLLEKVSLNSKCPWLGYPFHSNGMNCFLHSFRGEKTYFLFHYYY